MDLQKMSKIYLKIRDARANLKRDFDAQDAKLKGDLTKIEGFLLKFLQDNNTDSIKTNIATIYRQEDITPTAGDWDAFYQWVRENDAFDALEKRIKKTFINEYMEAHDGGVPPGVSVYREYKVRVRRT